MRQATIHGPIVLEPPKYCGTATFAWRRLRTYHRDHLGNTMVHQADWGDGRWRVHSPEFQPPEGQGREGDDG